MAILKISKKSEVKHRWLFHCNRFLSQVPFSILFEMFRLFLNSSRWILINDIDNFTCDYNLSHYYTSNLIQPLTNSSQFNYCLMAWVSHRRGLNNKVKSTHKRALRIVYRDKKSSFKTWLKGDKSVSINMINFQYLANELFKEQDGRSLEIMKEIFVFQENETLRIQITFNIAPAKMKISLSLFIFTHTKYINLKGRINFLSNHGTHKN